MSQSARIQYIIKNLVQGDGISLKEISNVFEVSTRQAGRDIEFLRDQLSAPIEYSYTSRKYELKGVWESYTNLDERMIIMGAYMKSLFENMPLGSFMEDEIKHTLEDGMSSKAKRVLDKVIYRAPSLDLPDYNLFSIIADALSEDVCLRLKYRNLKGEVSERLVEPEKLINYENSWYLIGYDYKREDIRTFHLSRMQEASSEGMNKHRISQRIIDKYIKDGFGIFIGQRNIAYTIKFSSIAALAVSSQLWHPEQKVEYLADGSIILTVPSYSSTELINRMLVYGQYAEPLSPESFINEYKERVKGIYDKAFGN